MGRKKNEMETRGNSEKRRRKGKTGVDRLWEDKDKRSVVEMG